MERAPTPAARGASITRGSSAPVAVAARLDGDECWASFGVRRVPEEEKVRASGNAAGPSYNFV